MFVVEVKIERGTKPPGARKRGTEKSTQKRGLGSVVESVNNRSVPYMRHHHHRPGFRLTPRLVPPLPYLSSFQKTPKSLKDYSHLATRLHRGRSSGCIPVGRVTIGVVAFFQISLVRCSCSKKKCQKRPARRERSDHVNCPSSPFLGLFETRCVGVLRVYVEVG